MTKKKKIRRQIVYVGFECKQCVRFMNEPRRRSGICSRCAFLNVGESVVQLQNRRGVFFEKWRNGLHAHLAKLEKEKHV